MNNFFKFLKLFLLVPFLFSCGSVGEALQGKKRSDQGDEFLIDKKNPLVMPPDFNKLPKPGEANAKSIKDIQSNEESLEELLKVSKSEESKETSEQSTSIESSILKKIE